MSSFNATALIVDDRDPSVTYSPGWQQQTTTAEFDGTKSGAAEAGMTASFNFTGTGVEVYGAIGSWDVYGVPVSSYTIDGGDEATYTAPLIQPGFFESRILFYRSPPLNPGVHTLVLTNKNGTIPCVHWLDYFVYTPVVTTSLLPSKSPTSAPSTPPAQQQPSASVSHASTPSAPPASLASGSIQQGPVQQQSTGSPSTSGLVLTSQPGASASSPSSTSLTPIIAATANGVTSIVTSGLASISSGPRRHTSSADPSPSVIVPGAAASTSRTRISTGTIAGSALGGVAILLFLLVVFFLWHRRKRQRSSKEGLAPFVIDSNSSIRTSASRSSGMLGLSVSSDAFEKKTRNTRNVTSGTSFASPDATALADNLISPRSLLLDGATLAAGLPTPAGAVVFTGSSIDERDTTPSTSNISTSTPSDPRIIFAKLRDMRHAREESRGSSPELVVRHHEDSGVRMQPPAQQEIVDIPPAYSTN